MKKLFLKMLSMFLAISIFLGVNATPVSAESGLSEAMHLDAGSDLFDVLLFILLFPSIIFTSFVLIVETIVEFVASSFNL